MPLLEGGRPAPSVFTTNPAELMLCLQVHQLLNSPPATLASICPGSFLLDQLCFQFVEFRHVVPMAKQAGLSTVSVLGVSRHRRRKVLLGGLSRLCSRATVLLMAIFEMWLFWGSPCHYSETTRMGTEWTPPLCLRGGGRKGGLLASTASITRGTSPSLCWAHFFHLFKSLAYLLYQQ